MRDTFINTLLECGGISSLQARLLKFLTGIQKNLNQDALNLFALLLAKQSDGDTRISVEEGPLRQTISKKMQNLGIADFDQFSESIVNGASSIKQGAYGNIIDSAPDASSFYQKPFILQNGFLYPSKYYFAKVIVEDKVKEFFNHVPCNESEIQQCIQTVESITRGPQGGGIKLEQEQALAVIRGRQENLIVTGGPGTGKTTVTFFLLRELYLSSEKHLQAPLYLAAPSGKAADRMKESIEQSVNLIGADEFETNLVIYNKMSNADSYTLHRLLGYKPDDNKFIYNSENRFPENSVFVIDESSMIDLTLFANFLQALPHSARVFLLGDAHQLPSVDAGAVLGELLESKADSTVKLTVSRRFNENSAIGHLAKLDFSQSPCTFVSPSEWDMHGEVQLLNLDTRERSAQLQRILEKWASEYLDSFVELAAQVTPNKPNQDELLERVWNFCTQARILSAERSGPAGVQSINDAIERLLLSKAKGAPISKIIMLNRNQGSFKLYNGDTGILFAQGNGEKFILFKSNRGFVFYPEYQFAPNVLETAFAITIHKAQGSEYDNVLMFIPTRPEHPLLNRQILYTGITRAKESVTIVATPETFKAACETVIERDTGIEL
ncbi:MAG: AAA family ATPase [Fibrobacter sp.]|nr:AAA family ATPase [Fibrobacter sp.]